LPKSKKKNLDELYQEIYEKFDNWQTDKNIDMDKLSSLDISKKDWLKILDKYNIDFKELKKKYNLDKIAKDEFNGKEINTQSLYLVKNIVEQKTKINPYLEELKRVSMMMKGEEPKKGGAKGYALHTVLVNKNIPFEEAFKEAQNIIKKKKFFHRETKNQYRFRNIPKQKFEPKSFKSKKVNKDITLVFGQLKPEHMHLEGAGLFDWLKEKASTVVSKVGEFFKPRLDNYNNKSKKTIEQYGNIPVKQLFISRTPVGSMLNTLINFVSLGKWEELKKKYAFDKLFHLSLVARLENGKDVILEKNEVVNISPDYKVYKDTESLDIPFTGEMTINKILETARKNVGDKTFFDYDINNNCQFFIKYLLEGQGLYSQKAKDFLFQDLKDIYEGLPSYVPYIMKGATRLGNIVNKITGGDKKNDIIMNQDDFIKEHRKLISLLRQFKDPKLLTEAERKAKVGADIDAELARMRSGPAGVGLGKKKKKIYKNF